jgi:DNA-binding NarL/FixJ family response regulator
LAVTNTIIIACTSLPFAQDIEGKILSHYSVRVSISQNDDDLRSRIKDVETALVLIEECFYKKLTAYVIGAIRDTYPELRFAVFSYTELDTDEIAYFFTTAASSFINFRLGPEECLNGIGRILKGDSYIPGAVKEQIQKYENPARIKTTLIKREMSILFLLAAGQKLEYIALLKITPGTVRIHKNNIYAKCGIHTMIDLMRFADNLKKQKGMAGYRPL